jgi:hypothetical protein
LFVTNEVRLGSSPTLSKVGFHGATPSDRADAYNQTANSTVSRTQIAAAASTAATSTTPFGYTTQAQADAIRAAANRALELVNALIDDLQEKGIVG